MVEDLPTAVDNVKVRLSIVLYVSCCLSACPAGPSLLCEPGRRSPCLPTPKSSSSNFNTPSSRPARLVSLIRLQLGHPHTGLPRFSFRASPSPASGRRAARPLCHHRHDNNGCFVSAMMVVRFVFDTRYNTYCTQGGGDTASARGMVPRAAGDVSALQQGHLLHRPGRQHRAGSTVHGACGAARRS